jgi:hypothetical protein
MSDESAARLKAAIDEFGASLKAAVQVGIRQGFANQLADDFGPGPWVLHPDGHVEPYNAPVTPIRKTRKTQTQTGAQS